MGEFTYLVFLAVAGLAATLIAVFTAGIAAVLLSDSDTASHHESHAGTGVAVAAQAQRHAA